MAENREEEFNATHSYFIGPKGANLPDFRANINTILDELLEARQNYYPEDQVISQLTLEYLHSSNRSKPEVHFEQSSALRQVRRGKG